MAVARAIVKESATKTVYGASNTSKSTGVSSSDSDEESELLLDAAETLCALVARQVTNNKAT